MKREMWQCPVCRWWNVGHFGACTSCEVVNPAVQRLLEAVQPSREDGLEDEEEDRLLIHAD